MVLLSHRVPVAICAVGFQIRVAPADNDLIRIECLENSGDCVCWQILYVIYQQGLCFRGWVIVTASFGEGRKWVKIEKEEICLGGEAGKCNERLTRFAEPLLGD